MAPNVLHYVRRWLPVSSGFVHAHIVRSARDGVVVTPEPREDGGAFALPPSRPVRSLAPVLQRWPDGAGRRPLSAALAAVAAAHRVGLVHVHLGYGADDVVGMTRRTGRPLVLSLHGEDATGTGAATRYRDVVDAVDAVVVPSRFLAGVVAGLGFDPGRVHVVPSGVDTATFRPLPPPDGPPRAAFVGRLVEKKGLDVLLAAWPSVRAAVPGAVLHVIGDGPQAELLAAAPEGVVHERPEPGRRVEQVRSAIAGAHLVVQPSRTAADGDAESLLLVNLEAQASARPVVSTRHGGIPEYVDDGRTGVLVPEADPTALAFAVADLLADPRRAAELGAAGPAWAARFDVRACTASVDALYDRLLGGRSTK